MNIGQSGKLPAQIEKLKALYARGFARLKALDTYLPDAQITRPEGGFFYQSLSRKAQRPRRC